MVDTDTTVKSRTEWLAKFQREYGTDYLLDVIREARVGVSNVFCDEGAMDEVITLETSGDVLEVYVLLQVDADVVGLALLVHTLLRDLRRNLRHRSVFFMADAYDTGSGDSCQIARLDKHLPASRISPSIIA